MNEKIKTIAKKLWTFGAAPGGIALALAAWFSAETPAQFDGFRGLNCTSGPCLATAVFKGERPFSGYSVKVSVDPQVLQAVLSKYTCALEPAPVGTPPPFAVCGPQGVPVTPAAAPPAATTTAPTTSADAGPATTPEDAPAPAEHEKKKK